MTKSTFAYDATNLESAARPERSKQATSTSVPLPDPNQPTTLQYSEPEP
jgi:hypothetical protein